MAFANGHESGSSATFTAILEEKLQWSAEIYLYHTNGAKELIYSTGNTALTGATKPHCQPGTTNQQEYAYIFLSAASMNYPRHRN
ncbi:hypothetical protein HX776_02550 [Pseudomonas agarici]|uniref:hypothetical protein n=1 Tax=Pseudomonas agarici TaxID=46677 RepID=UPI00115FE8F6|nr:hypothetical protein [Pseudomonas agarici]NWC07719.1 hypothetical protein [Pseudomonas agarici]